MDDLSLSLRSLLCSVKPLKLYRSAPEITMPRVNLSGMTVDALMDLREQVDELLLKRRAEIQQQLERMGEAIAGARVVRRGGSTLR
jgi:hypothetical protein